jgi:hypothetical protein
MRALSESLPHGEVFEEPSVMRRVNSAKCWPEWACVLYRSASLDASGNIPGGLSALRTHSLFLPEGEKGNAGWLARREIYAGIMAEMHQNAFMRTTIDLPNDLYRALKARAGLKRYAAPVSSTADRARPAFVRRCSSCKEAWSAAGYYSPSGVPIPDASRAELRCMEEEDGEAKHT